MRVRALHWIDRLTSSRRIDADTISVHGPGFDGGAVPTAEHVLLVRNIRRLTRGGAEQRLLSRADLGVYDLDDGLPWDDGNLPGLGHWTKRPFPRARVARRAAGAADRLIVGNHVLADWATEHCVDVRLIPTCVEPGNYEVRSAWELPERPVIGWIGSPATEHYLADIAPALAEVHRATGASVQIISGPGDVPAELAGFTTREVWVEGVERRIATWDVGVMPLRDGVYERAKCGYKLLQYAASGVPLVGSPVGVNASMIAAMDGLAPTALDEWTDSLVELLTESADRRAARAAAGLGAIRQYSYDAWEDSWVDAVGW